MYMNLIGLVFFKNLFSKAIKPATMAASGYMQDLWLRTELLLVVHFVGIFYILFDSNFCCVDEFYIKQQQIWIMQ